MLGDRRIDHAAIAEFLQQALADLVGALIFRDLLAHEEDVGIAPHLFGHGVAQRIADGLLDHLGAFRDVRIGLGHRLRRGWRFLLRAAAGFIGRCFRLGFGLCFRLGFGGRLGVRLLRRCCRRLVEIGGALAVGEDGRNRRIHGDVGGAFRNQDPAELALIRRLDLHGRLVGLDLGNDVTGLDGVAFLLQPFGEVALLHRGRQRGHQHLNGHGDSEDCSRALSGRCRCRARTPRARDRAGRNPPPH